MKPAVQTVPHSRIKGGFLQSDTSLSFIVILPILPEDEKIDLWIIVPMNHKQKRILWLFNHETLRNFEVPLLRRLG
jgi:hypothetical protein